MVHRFVVVCLLTGLGLHGVRDDRQQAQPATDKPPVPAPAPQKSPGEIKVVHVEHAFAPVLGELLGKALRGGEGSPGVMVNVDKRTNSLILSGSTDGLAKALELIKARDAPVQAGAGEAGPESGETWVEMAG